VVVHDVAARRDRQTAAAMFRERLEHMIEELHVGRDVDRSTVERETQIDLRLFGRALDDRSPRDQFRTPFAAGTAISTRCGISAAANTPVIMPLISGTADVLP